MKKYKHHQQLTRNEQQRLTGGWRNNGTYCFGFQPGYGSFATLVSSFECNPQLCCTAIPNPYGYSCGAQGFAQFLDCSGGDFGLR
jgi:hypothetical protein